MRMRLLARGINWELYFQENRSKGVGARGKLWREDGAKKIVAGNSFCVTFWSINQGNAVPLQTAFRGFDVMSRVSS
jgi:hypothetical protein